MSEQINFKHNNINYKLINTNKYKMVTGIVSMARPLKKEDYTYYSLLNRLIGSSSKNYSSKKEIANKMFELYDCSVYMTTNYSYKSANSCFIFQTISKEYCNDKLIVKKCIDLLKEIMFNPLIEDNKFNLKNFNEEVKALENDIKNIYNNKKKYAYKKLLEGIEPNSLISCSMLGDIDVLKTITPEKLYNFYQQVLNESMINVGVIGNITKEEVISYFDDFNLFSKCYNMQLYPKTVNFKDKTLILTEKQDIVQTKLLMGFRYDIDYQSEYYIPLTIFNAMFGGMFGSSLFMNIRERLSLTYDINSELIINKKILLVSCGIDEKNIEIVSDLVIKELENYKQGKIDENLFVIAKDFLINDLLEMQDSQYSILSFELDNLISKRPSLDELLNQINTSKIEDIIEVSKMIKSDTIFSLVPGDNNE